MHDIPDKVKKRQARSGKVSTSEPTILHNTSRSRISIVPYYVPHSSRPDELAVKLIRYKKQKAGVFPPIIEDGAINLDGPATLQLLKALQLSLNVANEDDGSYVLLKIDNGTADIGSHDPAAIANALAKQAGLKDKL